MSIRGLRSAARGNEPAGASRQPRQANSGPSVQMLTIRVAMTAATIVGVAYLAIAVVVAVFVQSNITSDVDRHLISALDNVAGVGPEADNGGGSGGPGPNGFDPGRQDPRGVPLLLWKIPTGGTASAQGYQMTLPTSAYAVTAPTTVSIDGSSYRIAGRDTATARYVVAQSLDSSEQTEGTLIAAEVGIGCALLIAVFLGALAVGRRVAIPIERERQRQLEFTADASHELRTPLSVIEAQTSLALARQRESEWDGRAFGRIDTELRRTRRLVDDMLWLARFDSSGGRPESEPVDMGVLAAQTADRFSAVAESRNQKLTVAVEGTDAIVMAPPDWLDRLVGVLLDNALKYSPEGGSVSVSVTTEGRRVRLSVDDSGPGIPPSERGRVFDRFHRATNAAGGAGLGLAIADAIARSTGAHWHIGTSSEGGASVSATWPRHLAS